MLLLRFDRVDRLICEQIARKRAEGPLTIEHDMVGISPVYHSLDQSTRSWSFASRENEKEAVVARRTRNTFTDDESQPRRMKRKMRFEPGDEPTSFSDPSNSGEFTD